MGTPPIGSALRRGRLLGRSVWLLAVATLASADDFSAQVRPILQESCLDCHSTKKQKGDLDLERFTSLAEVQRDP